MVTPNLPWELEAEILSRVPPTSVKQLQLTCKRWYALFKDPIFIKNHLGKAATQMILTNDELVYSFKFNFHGIHNHVIELTDKLRSLKNSEDVKISTISHCKGLLLCMTKDNRLVVWNPCTGQTRWIQSKPSSSISFNTKYYLGYGNKSCNNYKILSCSFYRSVCRFEIYEFNSDSWRVVAGDWYLVRKFSIPLNGNTYWFVSDYDDPMNTCILRFDFTTEIFERLPLPSSSDDHNRLVVLSAVREEKLALLGQCYSGNTGSLKMKIWVTNTKTDDTKDLSWSEFLVVEFGIDSMPLVSGFLVDEENKKVMCCDTYYHDEPRTRIYIVGEDRHKNVTKRKGTTSGHVYREVLNVPRSTSTHPRLVSYVPSLVQIPKKAE